MFSRPSRIIIPQYEAPKDLSLLAAAELLGDGKRAIAAQIIDFAVRKVITISRKQGARKGSGFTLTLVADVTTEGIEEQGVLAQLFAPGPYTPGATVAIRPGRNRELGQRLKQPHRDAIAHLIGRGLAREQSLWVKLLTPSRKAPVVPTEAAYPLVDHLWGLHDYIRLAEKDRLAFLQSPDGAQRRGPLNELEVLILNEKLLPYAVLFGLEKQWMKELDVQYRDLPVEFAADLGDVLLIAEFLVDGVQVIDALADLATLVDAADALEGVGAVFGGIGEALGNLDFPDFS